MPTARDRRSRARSGSGAKAAGSRARSRRAGTHARRCGIELGDWMAAVEARMEAQLLPSGAFPRMGIEHVHRVLEEI